MLTFDDVLDCHWRLFEIAKNAPPTGLTAADEITINASLYGILSEQPSIWNTMMRDFLQFVGARDLASGAALVKTTCAWGYVDVEVVGASSRTLLVAKNNDYTAGGDPFANFKMVQLCGACSVEGGMLARMCDKIGRAHTWEKTQSFSVHAEAVADLIEDIVNYTALVCAWCGKEGST